MRFILLVKATAYSEAGVANKAFSEEMTVFKKSLAKAGVLVAEEELYPSSSGIRVSYSVQGTEPKIMAGPFSIDQGLIAEYVIIDVKTVAEAAKWVLRMPIPRERALYEIEMRQLKEKQVIE